MKRFFAVLCLVSISLAAHAGSTDFGARQLADRLVAKWNAEKSDLEVSRSNPKGYYESKLSSCLFEQDVKNSLNDVRATIDFNSCSGVISQALSRGDLSEAGVREVIDSLSAKRMTARSENAARIERQKQIEIKADELVEYGNKKLN